MQEKEYHFGRVVLFNVSHGYGFIESENQPQDTYFHATALPGPPTARKSIAVGTAVRFTLGTWRGGVVARNVEIVSAVEPELEKISKILGGAGAVSERPGT
jgi:cold shock CspA family protein